MCSGEVVAQLHRRNAGCQAPQKLVFSAGLDAPSPRYHNNAVAKVGARKLHGFSVWHRRTVMHVAQNSGITGGSSVDGRSECARYRLKIVAWSGCRAARKLVFCAKPGAGGQEKPTTPDVIGRQTAPCRSRMVALPATAAPAQIQAIQPSGSRRDVGLLVASNGAIPAPARLLPPR